MRQFALAVVVVTVAAVPASTGVVSAQPQQCGPQPVGGEIAIEGTIAPGDTQYYRYSLSDSSLTLAYETNVKLYVKALNYEKYEVAREYGFDSALEQYQFVSDNGNYRYSGGLAFASTAESVTNINNEGTAVTDERIRDFDSKTVGVAQPVIVIQPGSGTFQLLGIPDEEVCFIVESDSDAAAGDVSIRETVVTPTPTPTPTATPPPQTPEPETPTPQTPEPETGTPEPATPLPETPATVGTEDVPETPSGEEQADEVLGNITGGAGPGFGPVLALLALSLVAVALGRRA